MTERIWPPGVVPYTPALHVAAWYGCPDIIHLLINHGVDLDKLAAAGEMMTEDIRPKRWIQAEYTALQVAMERGHLEAVKILSQAGASHCIFKADARLPQGVVVPGMSLHYASLVQDYELVKWLVESGYQADVNALDESGMPPLAYWSILGTQDSIGDYLIRKGASPNLMVSDDCNLLLDACWHGRFEAALMLLRHGASVNNTSRLFTTPLLASCVKFNRFRRDWGLRLEDAETNWPEVHGQYSLFVDRGLDRPALRKWECLRAVVVQKLIDAGADVEDTSNGDASPLLLASRSFLAPVVSSLLEAGASVKAGDSSGQNALLAALKSECDLSKPRLDTVLYLLEACCDVRQTAENGESVLHAIGFSIENYMFGRDIWDDTLLRLLLERGADAQARAYCGIPAFHLFSASGNYILGYAACKMLIGYGVCEDLAKEELCAVINHHFWNGPGSEEPGTKERSAILEMLLEVYARRFVSDWRPYLQDLPMVKDNALVKEVLETVCQDCNPTGYSTQFAWLVAELRRGADLRERPRFRSPNTIRTDRRVRFDTASTE
ncbi:ankyrin repeat-containing domain protein [Apiospora marii]|uniref:Ankyrin repeat-containing domain protein n=1 Tax=Apiospora marii TaxID=335849 RepID=A0ABR1RA22_9PEZI